MMYQMLPMKESERKYTFNQSHQIEMQTGLIGYLRADMDSNGKGFFSTWNEFNSSLKTEEFKHEFDDVINALRLDNKFEKVLYDRDSLRKYCADHPEIKYNDVRNFYGIRVNSDNYAYLLKLNPNCGDYNLYCYCYKKEYLDNHLMSAEKGIRFIDSHYKTLFYIQDGEKIRINFGEGKSEERYCRYIDQTHVEVGNNLYHICEFAERMEANGYTYEPAGPNTPTPVRDNSAR